MYGVLVRLLLYYTELSSRYVGNASVVRVETRAESAFAFLDSPMNQFLEVDVNRVSNSGFFLLPALTKLPRPGGAGTTTKTTKRTEAVLNRRTDGRL